MSPEELADTVAELYLADMGEVRSAANLDQQAQLGAYLSGKPLLAEEVLQVWLRSFGGELDDSDRAEAQRWFDFVLLAGVRST